MWKTDATDDTSLGLATWDDANSANSKWRLDARGGRHGISLFRSDDSQPCFQLSPVDEQAIPQATESFVRGRELHVSLPQNENVFGIRLTVEPIRRQEDLVVFEFTISIQTTLLDSHPMMDIISSGKTTQPDKPINGSPGISICSDGDSATAILLGRHDSPFTTNHSTESELSLRLFGDFLEKGVIRKARPWVAISPSKTISESLLSELLEELNASPLPLTP